MTPLIIDEKDRVLVIAPHPDDESIGCGGLLSMFPGQCEVLVVTDGAKGSNTNTEIAERKIRWDQFVLAMEVCGIKQYQCLGYPDGEMIGNKECLSNVDFTRFTKVFIPGENEDHPDHVAIFRYALNEIYKLENKNEIGIYQYEVHTPICTPSHYLDITGYAITNKLKMINCHTDQVEFMPYDMMALKLSEYRAYSCGMKNSNYEAFMETCFQDNESIDLEVEYRIQKLRNSNRALSRWLEQIHVGIGLNVIDRVGAFPKNGISIYGFSTLGRLATKKIEENGIKVVDVFDMKDIESGGHQTIRPENGNKKVDLVIVTVLEGEDAIREKLLCYGYNNVATIQELLGL